MKLNCAVFCFHIFTRNNSSYIMAFGKVGFVRMKLEEIQKSLLTDCVCFRHIYKVIKLAT